MIQRFNTPNNIPPQKPNFLGNLLKIGLILATTYLVAKLFEYLFDDWEDDEVAPRLFISHSWNYDRDYWDLLNKFEQNNFRFYNHSIDNLSPNNINAKQIEENITRKMRGCSKVIVLAGPYSENYWIKKEIDIANQLGKEVIAVRPWKQPYIPRYIEKHATKVIGYKSPTIIEHLKY